MPALEASAQGRVDDSHIKVSLVLVVSVRVRVRRSPGTKAPLPKVFQKVRT